MSTPSLNRDKLLAGMGQDLRQLGIVTVMFHHAVAERLGLNVTDSRALSILDLTGPITAGRLAELTGLTTGAVTGIVDRLETAGYVRREAHPSDRRKVLIRPVHDPAAERELRRIFEPYARDIMREMARYTDDELALIHEFVTRSMELTRAHTRRLRGSAVPGEETEDPGGA